MTSLPYTRLDWFWHWAKAAGMLALSLALFAVAITAILALVWAVTS
jgi:hypothetical protein